MRVRKKGEEEKPSRRRDSSPQPLDHETSVLPLCYNSRSVGNKVRCRDLQRQVEARQLVRLHRDRHQEREPDEPENYDSFVTTAKKKPEPQKSPRKIFFDLKKKSAAFEKNNFSQKRK